MAAATVPEVISFFDTYIRAGSSHRVKFSSQFFGQGTDISPRRVAKEGAPEVVYIDDHIEFKRSMMLAPKANHLDSIIRRCSE